MLSLMKVITPRLAKQHKKLPRAMTQFMMEYFKESKVIGVEIGVQEGKNALCMLKHLNIEKLYLIDPYLPYQESGEPRDSSWAWDVALKNLKPYRDKITFLKQASHEAVEQVPDDLDFVYVDGNHEGSFVQRDIHLYYPKVRRGGIFGGHDFCVKYAGLCRAVLDFLAEHPELTLMYKLPYTDWFVWKPVVTQRERIFLLRCQRIRRELGFT
jgi:hypothetical protein